jgi:hypothetical protein
VHLGAVSSDRLPKLQKLQLMVGAVLAKRDESVSEPDSAADVD